MSLLTNEQIEELVGLASNQSTSKDLHEEFHEWNEKQTGEQVYVNWDTAPKKANKASIRLMFINKNNGLSELAMPAIEIAAFYRPKPVITPHPHAEMIAKYAEIAARRVDPWVEFQWEIGCVGSENWGFCDRDIGFNENKRYRHIGETK